MELFSHLLGQTLDSADGKEVRGVALDERTKMCSVKGIPNYVRGSRPSPVFERLVMTGNATLSIGTSHP
jgi:hypothetical protein